MSRRLTRCRKSGDAGRKFRFAVHRVEQALLFKWHHASSSMLTSVLVGEQLISSEVVPICLMNSISCVREARRPIRQIFSQVPADVIAVQVGEKYRRDRIQPCPVSLEVGNEFAGRGIPEHLSVRSKPRIGKYPLITRCKHERAQVVAKKLAFEILGKPVVKRCPGFERCVWKQDPRVERDAAVSEGGDVHIADLKRVV